MIVAGIRFHNTPLVGLDAMTASTDLTFPRHTHDQYGLGVIDSGGHASRSDRRQVEAGPGTLISVNPGEVHDGRPIGGRSRSWRILYFDPELMNALQSEITERGAPPLAFASAAFHDPPLRALFEAAFRVSTLEQTPETMMECETLLLRLVGYLGSHQPPRAKSPASSPSIGRAVELIEADPAGPALSLERLARAAGISRYQLIRGFARAYSLTPHAYILQRRLGEARRLVRAGTGLAEVAIRSGFYDQSHLTRCFVRQFGITPGRYAVVSR